MFDLNQSLSLVNHYKVFALPMEPTFYKYVFPVPTMEFIDLTYHIEWKLFDLILFITNGIIL